MSDTAELRHRIGAVVRLTGVSAHALRAWERRYRILEPGRSEGGDRLYSEADVKKLRLFKRLTDYGHSIGDIARLDETTLEQLLNDHTQGPARRSDGTADETVHRYLDALEALDLDSAERVLQRAAITRSAQTFIDHVAVPLLHAIGDRWQSGSLCIANEHAASAMLRTHLGALLAELPVDPHAPTLVSATPSGERHEIGALFAAIVGALAGWRAIYLGPDLPASEIATAARSSSARVVLLSLVALSPRKAKSELEALTAALPARTRVVVGGSAAAAAARDLEGVELTPDLGALGAILAVPR